MLGPCFTVHVDGRLVPAFGCCVRICPFRGFRKPRQMRPLCVPCVSALCVCMQWCIKAKVTRKGLMRSFGAGGAANKVFDADLADAAVRQGSAQCSIYSTAQLPGVGVAVLMGRSSRRT